MIYSMTGYGGGAAARDGREMTLELRSVNHRFLDVALRMPRHLNFLEEGIRERIAAALGRGHVDVFVNYKNLRPDARTVELDTALIGQYCAAADAIAGKFGVVNDLTVSQLMRLPDAVSIVEAGEDKDEAISLAAEALDVALTELKAMRQKEGERLVADISRRAELISGLVERIKDRAPTVVVDYRDRLHERVAVLLPEAELDRARLATEVALFADRASVDEEITRLISHLAQMHATLRVDGGVGKRLDFLVQECNRELNTIGSKANDAQITECVLLGKAEVEKIREQVQNIE